MKYCLYICMQISSLVASHVLQVDVLTPFIAGNQTSDLLSFEKIITVNANDRWTMQSFSYVEKTGAVYGHHIVVGNPFHMLTVAFPPGACSGKVLQTVMETSDANKCLVAVNAGFFHKSTGSCYGNIISNRKKIRSVSSETKMAEFAIKQDGSIGFGYQVKDTPDNPIIHLVSGVGWVLRNGNIYVNESYEVEKCGKDGIGDVFHLKSARTLIGVDRNGWVHLMQIDGKTGVSGVTLHQAAVHLQRLGVVNAINLSGGGASTLVVGNTLVNYPSNVCLDDLGNEYLCAMNVSSIICIKRPGHTNYESAHPSSACCRHGNSIVAMLSALAAVCMLVAILSCYMCLRYRGRYINLIQPVFGEEKLKMYLERNASLNGVTQ